MTGPVTSYSQSQGLTDPLGSTNAGASSASSAAASSGSLAGGAVASGEAVTLTPEAQTSTALLEAAREATGVDLQAVQSLKAQITAGNYQVPPGKLAASIMAALSETH